MKKVQEEQEGLFVSKNNEAKRKKKIKGSRATSAIQNLPMM